MVVPEPKPQMVVLQRLLKEDAEGVEKKLLSNGDVYVGTFKGALPHGKGEYTWSDGTVYEGDWEQGKMTGKGHIIWSSGAKYEGDFSGGYLHGFGSFMGSDRSEYRGAWRMNIQHGLGTKQYPNADVYDGSWKEGVHDGCGRYSWNSGNIYIGNWKDGKMSGRGVMKWASGDLYDGLWLNGLRHGSGVSRFSDGGYYFGMWSRGLKDGKGILYPAGTKHPSLRRWCSSLGCEESGRSSAPHSLSLSSKDGMVLSQRIARTRSEKMPMSGILRTSGSTSHATSSVDENWVLSNPSSESFCHDPSCMLSHISEEGQSRESDNGTVVYEREYVQGVLTKETVRTAEVSRKNKKRNKLHVKEVKKKACVDVFEGHRSYYLMLNLQLGIRYTVGKITPVPRREVRPSDFGDRARIRMYFPRKGSQFTPPHYSIDFHWKDYCPMVFRNLREMFKLDAAEYMMSICGDDGLREFSSSGKSGSIFYTSHDDRFVIKTLNKPELKTLLKMLPKYYAHVGHHENTLITKFFGVHRITLRGRRKVRFVVMGNMFCTELRIHRRYDLKGSTHGRFTTKKVNENTTLKDCDLEYEFHMDKLLRESLFEQFSLDCRFLESQQIIDYSLLLGLHFRAPEQLKAILEPPNPMPNHESLPDGDYGSSRKNVAILVKACQDAPYLAACVFLPLGTNSRGELLIPPKGLLLVTHEPSFVNTTPGPHVRGNTLRAFSVGEKEVDLLLPGTGRLRVQLGVNMPAQASHKLLQNEVDSTAIELFEVYDVVLYMGIIDILQEYNMRKKLEHTCKSLKFDPLSISVIEPKLYAKRFMNFLQQKVFPEQP